MRPPFNLRPWEIAELDDWQLVNVYFRPGDEDKAKDGVYWPVPDVGSEDQCDGEGRKWVGGARGLQLMYRERLRNFGLDEAAIEARWQTYLGKHPQLRRQVERRKRSADGD